MNLEKALRWIVLGGIFLLPLVPLVVSSSLFFPFITGKNFFFRIVVEIMAGAWIALALVHPAYRPRRNWLLLAFTIFLAVIALADIFGANVLKSFWSNFERMEGWVTLAHLFVYFVIASSMLTTETLWKRLFQTSLAVSLIVVVYALFQFAGVLEIHQGSVRLTATLGNATYLAVYLLFHMFIAALLLGQKWMEDGMRWSSSVIYGGLIVLQGFVLFFTETRGAMLGLVGGALLSALLLVISARDSRQAWRIATGVTVGILVLVGAFFMFKNTVVVQGVGPLKRLADISTTDNTVQARFMNWGMAWRGVQERPLLGWGQENYNLVFNKYYDPGMYAQEQWFDRVHNVIFDWLVAAGVLGLASYLALFGFALWMIWGTGAFIIPERAILTGLLAAYGFHNLFVFDQIVSYLLFATILAYIAARVVRVSDAPVVFALPHAPSRMLPVVAIVMVPVLWGSVWAINSAPLTANRALLQAVAPQQDPNENLAHFERAISTSYIGRQEAREQLIQGATQIGNNQNVPDEVKGIFFVAARDQMEAQITAAPDDARFPLFLGTLLDSRGMNEDAQRYLERAQELSPTKQSIAFQRGLNAMSRGDGEEAIRIFKAAYELAPEYDTARAFYATALIASGRVTEADPIVQPLVEKGAVDQRLIAAYASQGDFRRIIALWEGRLAVVPNDTQALFALAAAYFGAGDNASAIVVLEQAASINPELAAQAQSLIEQIKNGTAVLQK